MEKLGSGEFSIVDGFVRLRKHPSAKGPTLAEAPYRQEFIIADANNQEVARCHRFLGPNETPSPRWQPDPKEINWNGENYHQCGSKEPECEHCKAGIPTHIDKSVQE